MTDRPVVNKLAALSLAITDGVVAAAPDLAHTAIAALITVHERQRLSIGEIAASVGLTHSATVRLVDRLERDWLVRRQQRVGREVIVELTSNGRQRAKQLQGFRLATASAFLDALDEAERTAMSAMIDKIMQARSAIACTAAEGADFFCRMCDRNSCDCGIHAATLPEHTAAHCQPPRRRGADGGRADGPAR